MPKTTKYIYEYILQGYYFGQWDDLTAAEQNRAGLREIRADRKDYNQNEGGVYRIIKRRTLKN